MVEVLVELLIKKASFVVLFVLFFLLLHTVHSLKAKMCIHTSTMRRYRLISSEIPTESA